MEVLLERKRLKNVNNIFKLLNYDSYWIWIPQFLFILQKKIRQSGTVSENTNCSKFFKTCLKKSQYFKGTILQLINLKINLPNSEKN